MSAGSPDASILAGKLEDFSLPDILHVLQVSGKSGALFLGHGDGQTAVLTFRKGQVVQAICTESRKTLGDRLLETGAVSRADLQQALEHMTRFPGMRLGDALVERGAVTRDRIEAEVTTQIAETVEQLMSWTDADFEFRLGLVSPGQEAADSAVDLELREGLEARHVLLQVSLLKDQRERERQRVEKAVAPAGTSSSGVPQPPPRKVDADADAEARKILQWFDEGPHPQASETGDPERPRDAASYLSLSEELFAARGRGDASLLLLRYASEIFANGGLVLRRMSDFRILGQFGEAFWWHPYRPKEAKTHFAAGESPLFEKIVREKRPYAGHVAVTSSFGLAPALPRTPGAIQALALPLFFLGNVSLILFCWAAVAGAPDARALIALTRQVSVTLENIALREVAKRSGMYGR